LGFDNQSFSLSIGVGAGLKIAATQVTGWESISITDTESKKTGSRWIVDKDHILTAVNSTGVVGFTTQLLSKRNGRTFNTNIQISSGVAYDKDGKAVPNGVWMSEAYVQEASAAEEKNK